MEDQTREWQEEDEITGAARQLDKVGVSEVEVQEDETVFVMRKAMAEFISAWCIHRHQNWRCQDIDCHRCRQQKTGYWLCMSRMLMSSTTTVESWQDLWCDQYRLWTKQQDWKHVVELVIILEEVRQEVQDWLTGLEGEEGPVGSYSYAALTVVSVVLSGNITVECCQTGIYLQGQGGARRDEVKWINSDQKCFNVFFLSSIFELYEEVLYF